MKRSFVLILYLICCTSCVSIPVNVRGIELPHRQVIFVKVNGTTANISFWQKDRTWKRTYQCAAVIGRNGLAPIGEKKEGDGRTPQGIFDIQRSFGYASRMETGLNYAQVSSNDMWVDDVLSLDYNQWVTTTEAHFFERLKRNDILYRMAAVIEYNTQNIVRGAGSAIFMHIWRSYYKPTAGCVALSQRNMRRIMKKLDKDQKPLIIIEAIHGR